jgi:hypothetical protein
MHTDAWSCWIGSARKWIVLRVLPRLLPSELFILVIVAAARALEMDNNNYQLDDKLEPIMDRLEELRQLLFNKGGNDLVGRVILQIVEDSGMTLEGLERMWTRCLLFSDTKWETVAPSLGLRGDLGISQLELFRIPLATPPPSFHREVIKNALRRTDVYREPWNHDEEEARARVLEVVCGPTSSYTPHV